jgi:hypothetical protein
LLNETTRTHAACDELTSKFSFGPQSSPIPLKNRSAVACNCRDRADLEETNMVRILSIIAVLFAGSTVASAQGGLGHTPAEESACRGDAHRLCKNVLSDEFQVASCLQENRGRVSHGCRTVLESHKR